jgi:TonB family protein
MNILSIPLLFLAVTVLPICAYAQSANDNKPDENKNTTAQADPQKAKPDSAEEIFFNTDPKSWARVKRIVPPKYPEDAVKNAIGGTVDIEVLIDQIGAVKEIRSIKSTPNNPQFEEATRQVLKHWLFNDSRTSRCLPYETVGEARLNFAVKNGGGEISLTHRPYIAPTFEAQQAPIKMLNREEVINTTVDFFPRSARREGAQANLYALLTVDAKTGAIINVEVTHVITPNGFEASFAKASEEGLRKVKYPPFPNRSEPWKTCFDISYRLSGAEKR